MAGETNNKQIHINKSTIKTRSLQISLISRQHQETGCILETSNRFSKGSLLIFHQILTLISTFINLTQVYNNITKIKFLRTQGLSSLVALMKSSKIEIRAKQLANSPKLLCLQFHHLALKASRSNSGKISKAIRSTDLRWARSKKTRFLRSKPQNGLTKW